jgi:hypothetical protein
MVHVVGFTTICAISAYYPQSTGDRVVLPCLFCNKSFDDKDDVQRHIVTEHKLVIADVNLISQFQRYMKGNFLSL